eukprot:TRINITY_DN16457_c0_g1_i2.p1 TRINITY_DN16457_c0_g1~~TRINITY_DN16457_c0_g1_i2.p1  ORF type:complete len:542 (+),score=128.02 TRINITY_DN16457_c0_g1_i2:239-1864(+)
MQRVMLCTLLIEVQLDKLNKLGAEVDGKLPENASGAGQLQNQESAVLYNKAARELNCFLEEHQADLDSHTTFQLLQNHKRVNDSLSFAILKKDYEAVLLHYLNKHDYKAAIEVVNEIKDDQAKNSLMKRYAATFIKHETQLTIDSLSRYYPTIDPEPLVMSIINVDTQKRAVVNNYIRSVMNRAKSKLLYNLHVFFLAEEQSHKAVDELNEFLEQQETLRPSKPPLNNDSDFALVTFKNFGLVEAQIRAYGLLEFYEEAVSLAIENKKYALAKEYANAPQDEKLRKELWLVIAQALIKDYPDDTRIGLETMNESQILTLADILPFLSPNITLSSFKNDLASSLQSYGERLRELKGQMSDYSKSAEDINTQLKSLKNSCIPVPSEQYCDKCKDSLIGEARFYVFPCLHSFHRNCIIRWLFECKAYVAKSKLSRLQSIMTFMKRVEEMERKREESEAATDQSDIKGFFNTIGNLPILSFMRPRTRAVEETKKVEMNVVNQEKLRKCEEDLEAILSEDCILCGTLFIESVDAVFESPEENSWKI